MNQVSLVVASSSNCYLVIKYTLNIVSAISSSGWFWVWIWSGLRDNVVTLNSRLVWWV